MSWPELSDTLTALVSAFEPGADSGLTIKRAELVVPLETATGDAPDGPLVYARAPHSRWVSGFLPPTSLSRLVLETVDISSDGPI